MIALAHPETSVRSRLEEIASVVSTSRLNCFHSCRLKFYFRYILELVRGSGTALFVGKAVHAALQRWSMARWRKDPHDLAIVLSAFREFWINSQEEEPQRWKQGEEEVEAKKGEGLVEMYLRETSIPPDESVEAVEVKVEADLSRHGLPTLIGIIDLIRPVGRIVDFKTSATAPQPGQVLHRNETQLTAYGILYRDATGEKESGVELHHLVKTKTPKLVVSSFPAITEGQKTKFFRSVESYQDGVLREDFVPSPGLQCVGCEYMADCSAWKGGA
jgi:putative RecB family exonuclease